MEEDKKKSLIIVISFIGIMICFTLLVIFVDWSSNKSSIGKTNNNKIEEKNIEIPRTDKEKPTSEEEDNSELANLSFEQRLIKKGFEDGSTDERCYLYTKCFVNGGLFVGIDSSVWTDFKKDVTKDKMIKYDSSDDIILINQLYDVNISNKVINNINKLFEYFDDYFDSFNIDTGGLYIRISYRSGELEYNISNSLHKSDGFLDPTDINAILDKKSSDIKKLFYEILMDDNKVKYKYYEYPLILIDKYDSDICSIDLELNNNYILNSSFCHGGTSNTYFTVTNDKYKTIENDRIIVNIKGTLFKEKYVEIIENSLNYISEVVDANYNLSDNNINELNDFIKNDKEDISLEINDKVQLDIKYYPDRYNKNYILYFIIK